MLKSRYAVCLRWFTIVIVIKDAANECNFDLNSNYGEIKADIPQDSNCSVSIRSNRGTKIRMTLEISDFGQGDCSLQLLNDTEVENFTKSLTKQISSHNNEVDLQFTCRNYSPAREFSIVWKASNHLQPAARLPIIRTTYVEDTSTRTAVDITTTSKDIGQVQQITNYFQWLLGQMTKEQLVLMDAANECNFDLNSNYGEIKADIPQDSNCSVSIRSNRGTKIRMTLEISDFGQGDCSLQLLNDTEVENFTKSLTKQISSHNNEVDLQFTCRNYSPAREFSIVWKASNHLQPAARLPIIRTTYVEDTSTRTAVDITTTSKDIGQVQQITNYFQWLLGHMTKEQLVLMGRNSATSDSSKQGFHWMFGAGIVCGVLLISTLLLFVQRLLQYRKQRKLLIKSLKTDDRLKDDERKDGDGEDDSYTDVGGGMMQYESPNSQTKAKVFDLFHPNDSTEHTSVKRSHSYIEFIADENTKANANVHEETCDQYHMYEQIDDRERKETSTPENAKFYTSLTVTGETTSKVHVLKKRPSSI